MTTQKPLSPINLRNLEMYLVAILLGSLAGWGYWWAAQRVPENVTPVQGIELSGAIAKLKASLPAELAARLEVQPQTYWVSVSGPQDNFLLVSQPLEVDPQASTTEMLTTAIETLLSGTAKVEDVFTAIPKDTQLLSLNANTDGIYINLSQEFAAGGGSSSMIYRVAQVIYTVTSLEPDAAVHLAVAGHLIDDAYPLGGEGLVLDQPITRETFAKDFSL